MPRVDLIQPSFNAGEFSPRMIARTDFAKYRSALRKAENLIMLPQGGAMRRPGTRYVVEQKDSSARGRLIPFEFSTTQAYVIEAGNQFFRFLRNQGQITVADTDAVVTNGTFDSDVSDWDDNSTGSASIAWALIGSTDEGTFAAASAGFSGFGDAQGTNRKHVGLRFVSGGGTLVQVRVKTGSTHNAAGDCVARIYTNNSGSPGIQIGGDSDTVSVNAPNTVFTFTWSFNTPTLSASTAYWCIVSNTDTTLNSTIRVVGDQGSGFASGHHDTITFISDASGGFGAPYDLLAEVLVDDGSIPQAVLALAGASGEVSSAEQDITTPNTDQEHVLQFRVIGAPSDVIKFRVGSESAGNSILSDLELGVGFHSIAFTPDVSPFYVQFDNEQAKTIYIDDVALIDDAAVELVTPYTTAQLPYLRWTQSADTLYLCHGSHPVYKLLRRGHASWSLQEVNWEDGPYLAENSTTSTLQASAQSGFSITIAASAVTGINDDAGFSSTDIGRRVRISNGTDWGYAIITGVTDTLNVTADAITDLQTTSAVMAWRLGAWSGTTGYPQVATFHEQRLVMANTTNDPDKFWLSQSGDFENMRPDSNATGGGVETQDDDALDYRISSAQVNAIQWMRSGVRLMIGTRGGEFVVQSDGPILLPTDIDVKQQTSTGSAFIAPVQVDNAVLFVQRDKRKIREFAFNFEADGFRSPDLTILSEHITQGMVSQLVFAASPHSLVLALREDGRVAVLTYKREQDVVGWCRWTIGGTFSSDIAVVESLAVIPGNNGSGQVQDSSERDEIWMVVKRTIDGNTVRYIEVMEGDFEGPNRNDYTSETSYETALLAAMPDMYYADTVITYDSSATDTVSNLGHLEGEMAKVLADGGVHPDASISSGTITLDYDASVVQVGLGYYHDMEPLKLDFGNPAGSAIGKDKRIRKVDLVLHETGALKIGSLRDDLKEESLREVADLMDTAVPLFTGEFEAEIEGDYIPDPRIIFRGDDPTPFTLLAMVPDLQVE